MDLFMENMKLEMVKSGVEGKDERNHRETVEGGLKRGKAMS